MRVFVAGATGAIGRRLVPKLLVAGHEVTAMTRSAQRIDALRALGAEPVVCNVFDADRLRSAVVDAHPDAVIHELTDLPPVLDPDPAKFDEQFGGNIRTRIEGTRNLVDGAIATGARRVVAQSIAFAYSPSGGPVKTEDDPLDEEGPEPHRRSIEAVRALEAVVSTAPDLDGVVLRYGYFYGPGTFYGHDGSITELVRRGGMPINREGDDIASFIHVDDAAEATILALDAAPGIYNITDDEPAPLREWLPVFADVVGGPPPIPAPGTTDGVFKRGASNAKAKRELGWSLEYPSWREVFPASFTGA